MGKKNLGLHPVDLGNTTMLSRNLQDILPCYHHAIQFKTNPSLPVCKSRLSDPKYTRDFVDL